MNIYETNYRIVINSLCDYDKQYFRKCFVTRGQRKYQLLKQHPKDPVVSMVWHMLETVNDHHLSSYYIEKLAKDQNDAEFMIYWRDIASDNGRFLHIVGGGVQNAIN